MRPEESFFGQHVINILKRMPPLMKFYVGHAKFLNYAFVCGIIGVIVSYAAYHVSLFLIWEPVAYYIGVGIGAISNFTFTVGRLGRLFGLSKEEDKK